MLATLLISGQWPQESVPADAWEPLEEAARNEGVASALFELVSWHETASPAAASFREALAGEARRAAALEILNRIELERVLPRLAGAGHRFLLIKGAPLAYTLYPNPAHRTRCDTDLLVPPDDVDGFIHALEELGYREIAAIGGELVSHQKSLAYKDQTGNPHVCDVHWKISNRPGLADRIGFEELWAHRRDVTALGRGACAPEDVYALLLACLHLSGHHPGEERLIWLYDIHLLAQRLSAGDKKRFTGLCRKKDVVRHCLPVLSLAEGHFPSPALAEIVAALGGVGETAGTTAMRPSRLALLAEDLCALPGWRARLRLLKEHAFPGMDYMRARYGARSRCLLPYYYAKRAFKGAGGWLRRP